MAHTNPPAQANRQVTSKPSEDAIRRLADAVAHLGNDPEWFLQALTETLLAMAPVSPSKLTKQQELFLIESGTFTAETLARTRERVKRGSLQLGAAQAWLSDLSATMSLDDAAGFLGWSDEAVRSAATEGRLYAIEVSGRLRLPAWQFNIGSPQKLIPGLEDVIEVVSPHWSWHSVAGFMSTPQSSLVAEGRQTPLEWLRDGGDIAAVKQIVESDKWW